MTHQLLSSDSVDQAVLESFLDAHLWGVEEELRMCVGRPPWFDSALCFVLEEVIRHLAKRNSSKECDTRRVRTKARAVCEEMERTLAVRHAKHGVVNFANDETFEALVCSVLQRKRSLYWEELRRPKPLSPRCGPLESGD